MNSEGIKGGARPKGVESFRRILLVDPMLDSFEIKKIFEESKSSETRSRALQHQNAPEEILFEAAQRLRPKHWKSNLIRILFNHRNTTARVKAVLKETFGYNPNVRFNRDE